MVKLKVRIFNLIRDDDENDLASNIFDASIIAIIVINIVFVILDTFSLSSPYGTISLYVEIVSVLIFSIEYLLRLWTSDYRFSEMKPYKARFKYIFSFMALIDLMAILPFYIPFIIKVDLRVLRTFRLFRLLRLLKFNRYTKALSTIGIILKKKSSQLISSMFVIFILMIISSVLMYSVENQAQPDVFSNAFSGLWWSIATFTTVGYGDIYPITVVGKILSGTISILGIGLVAIPTGIIASGFVSHTEEVNDANENDKSFCPYCGKNLID